LAWFFFPDLWSLNRQKETDWSQQQQVRVRSTEIVQNWREFAASGKFESLAKRRQRSVFVVVAILSPAAIFRTTRKAVATIKIPQSKKVDMGKWLEMLKVNQQKPKDKNGRWKGKAKNAAATAKATARRSWLIEVRRRRRSSAPFAICMHAPDCCFECCFA
jgi:hypothetical protein